MELPQVGKHCEEPSCNILDFLPYTCKCMKTFCATHYTVHIQTCPTTISQQAEENGTQSIQSQQWRCSHPECKETSLLPLICPKCMQHFCIHHRHVTSCDEQADRQLREAAAHKMRQPVEQFKAAKAKIDTELDKSITAAINNNRKNKKEEMAIKLQLMRIKNKATGLPSIPSTDRVYFNVTCPAAIYNSKTQPVFVSRHWSLGRLIDAFASECKIINNNNVQNADKLQLFASNPNTTPYFTDLSQILTEVLNQKLLIDGQNVWLEYVPSTKIN